MSATLPQGSVQLQGLSLIDQRTGTSQALVTAPANEFRRVHSGDVKIYEHVNVLERAYVLPAAAARFVTDQAAALAALRDPTFDPRHTVAIESPMPADHNTATAPVGAPGQAEILSYAPEQVVISTTLPGPGYLVLSDAGYPGWRAWVDGTAAPVLNANLLFRAVALPAGTHEVVFRFEPDSLRRGAVVSLLAAGVVLCMLLLAWFYRRSDST